MEVRQLFDLKSEPKQDLSLMLNAERMARGATAQFLGGVRDDNLISC